MLQFQERVNLAFHALGYIAAIKDKCPVSVTDIARSVDVSKSHLAKVMQHLVKAGFVTSIRGAKGGFTFTKDPCKITLLEVYESINGPVRRLTCQLGTPICKPGSCIMKHLHDETSRLLIQHLGTTHVCDFKLNSKVA